MQKKKRYSTPKGKIFYRRYVVDFNPYNPKKELLDELDAWVTPSSHYITPSRRGIPLGSMDFDTASYIGYEAKMGRDEIRILAKLRYFILLAIDEDITKSELSELICDSELGLMESVKDEW